GDSFRALSTTPNSSSAQSVALTRADETARSLNQLSNTVQSLRTDADASIERSVSAVNSTLKKIQDINLEIGRLRVNGQSSADLEDKRDVLVDSLSKEIDISYFTRETGEIWIMTKSGRALLDTSVHTLQYSAKPAVDPSMRYVAPPGPSGFNGIVIDGVDVTGDIGGGRIAGYVGLRDNLLVQAQDQLDEMADGLINAFSSKGLVLFFDGTAAYNPVNKIGLAQRIAVNQNVVVAPRALRHGTNAAGVVNPIPVPDPVGDATLPLAIVASFETQRTFAAAPGLATVATLEGYANAFITFQGTQRANIGDQLENQSLITNSMDQRVRNDSGVNVDQELARLIQLQSSYSASARIISAVKDMFDALMRVA
ncbi:MAG: flagellar hook-associated protein FlgK, partial [Rhodospirillales bacterium]|nr:flagellar hook-associated protein FlgK [Rhodospirillales bacterium]